MNTQLSTDRKLKRKLANILSIVVILTMAFPVTGTAFALNSDPPSPVVGIVLPSENERWLRDAAELENVLQTAGLESEIFFSEEDPATENANVEILISHGIQVLIICPVDANVTGAVETARGAGVKIISYDRLVMGTEAVDFYITFDSVDVGKAQGQYLIDHAQGSGNPLYLYAGASWDNNSFLFFEGAWEVLQPKIDDGTFVIKNSSEAVSLQGNPTLTRDEESNIFSQITTNWSYDDAMNLAAANLSAVTAADKGNVFILAPNDGTARAISDTFDADPDVTSYVLTGQDADKESIQYIIYGKQSMTVFKDLRILANDAASAAIAFLQGETPEFNKTYNNGMIDVPARASDVVVVDRSNIRSALIDTGFYQASDFIWRDDFIGTFTEGWYWVNENPDKWTFEDGNLRIFASPYGTGGENLLLRPVTAGDFSIETRVFFEPDTNFQIAGLVLWQDESNFISFGRAFCDIEGGCVGSGIYFDKIINGVFVDGNFATEFYNPFNTAENYLRLERRGNMVRALYSHEGITWTEIGIHWLPDDFQVNGVGIQAAQDLYTPEWDIPADFDYFEMTEGWGFLPEGYHDYDSGDVPNWNCGVGGWATDPDDRLTDVAIEVGIDGTSLPYWLYASDYREDLYNAGVCEDGNCSFSMSLWDVMSSYEPHSIVTYAQDLQSGEWVQLSNSPKDLTCRTYDIYAYNPLAGTTEQLTDIRDAGEFNPSFSPNGKLVAHDVVAFDGSQSIYISDLTTGTSTPLSGAEAGGNDAAFSPNGKLILFDTAWTDTPNLYIVPVTGGTPTLVRENGISGDWAPNGKRIVFQDMDGSLRTIAVNKSSETYLVPFGQHPTWSPDGNWIAYTDNGDIWKIAVNVQGTVQGEPIQLTSGVRWDEQPAWSMDSLTVIFHASIGPDYDLWSVPAAGGDPVWLAGAVEFGDFDPAGAKNSADVAYASFSPEGQAPRTWVSVFTYDLPAGTWTEGTHSYHFETVGMDPTPEITFDVLDSEPLYDGKVLMRSGALRGRTGEECLFVNAINPAQQSQFHIGWTADGTYAEALSQLEALMPTVVWDGGAPLSLFQHEVFPFTSQVDWGGYVCSFTYP